MGAATGEGDRETLEAVRSVVFKPSETLDEERFPRISGYDFNRGVDLMGLLRSMATTGFQASNLGDAIDVVNQMVSLLALHFFPFFWFQLFKVFLIFELNSKAICEAAIQ